MDRTSLCRPLIASIVCGLAAIPANRLSAQPAEEFGEHCRETWPRDFEMREYCLERQREGYDEVAQFRISYELTDADVIERRYRAGDTAATILVECHADWPSDYEMLASCLDRQESSAQRLGELDTPEPDETAEAYDRVLEYVWRGGSMERLHECDASVRRRAWDEAVARLPLIVACLDLD